MTLTDILPEHDNNNDIFKLNNEADLDIKMCTFKTEEKNRKDNNKNFDSQTGFDLSDENQRKIIKTYEVKLLELKTDSISMSKFNDYKLLTFSDITNSTKIHALKTEREFKLHLLDGFSQELFTP